MEENKTNDTAVKTFTQEEVNAILGERLAREREKYEGINLEELKAKAEQFDKLEEANKSELQKANDRAASLESELAALKKANEVSAMRSKVAQETGIPTNLLTADSEEECKAQAEAIKAFANPKYPEVKDGGEVSKASSADTRTQFADWANKAFNN
jgi:predicted  nucleic acid-binding Zn-ribbon protein